MELALSLGDASRPFSFLEKKQSMGNSSREINGFCMGLALNSRSQQQPQEQREEEKRDAAAAVEEEDDDDDQREKRVSSSSDPPVQLDLLPFSPVPRVQPSSGSHLRFPWLSENYGLSRGLDVNRFPAASGTAEDVEEYSSPNSNSALSSFMEFSLYRNGGSVKNKRDMTEEGVGGASNGHETETEKAGGATSSRASDDEENGSTRKKLRLSKEQSAFLEESFKEHHTLNPKQKLALAKQLNLRPRQVEVWFQNRRARTKLKQTEVDCEYLKRCCETLTEENRRLQKELQELRALKTSQPFYMQLPATTLTMCPSCERVATTSTATPATKTALTTTAVTTPGPNAAPGPTASSIALSLAKPMLPFPNASQPHVHNQSAS
ncbi:homeobox-leucine zipper protein [Ancistrocladus abbreviatus]